MSPDEFYVCRRSMGASGRGLAEMLGCAETTVRKWEKGLLTIPPDIARWMIRCGRFHGLNPAPTGWRTRSRGQ